MTSYSPVYERAEEPTLAEEFLPTDSQTQNRIFRNIIVYDPVAGPATDYWRELAFSKYIRLGALNDPKLLQFYEDAIEASHVAARMPFLLGDYLSYGRFVLEQGMDQKKGYWTSSIVHDLDYTEIKLSPFPDDPPIINVQSNNEHQEWAISRDPRIVDLHQKREPEVIKMLALGDVRPLEPANTMFMPRMAYATDYYGTSYLTRIIPFKIMEKALIDSEVAAARRRAGPVWVISVPDDYEAEEIQEIIDQFFAIEEDPVGGKVAVRGDVTVNPIGGGKQDFWTLSEEYDFLKNAKLNALGISETFLSGTESFSSMEQVLHVFVEKLRAIRDHFTEQVVTQHMLRGLARMHGHIKRPEKQLAHGYRIARKEISDADLNIPSVEWDRPLEPHADLDYWDLLERLEQKGIPIPRRKWAQAAGYNLDETFQNADAEIEDRAKLYALKSALAKQAEKAGFDLEGAPLGGEIGGGGPGIGGGFEGPEEFGEGAGEFELGPGEEFELGGGGGAEAPPAAPELPAAPAEEGAGAGADLENARFPVTRTTPKFRHATAADYHDLERSLRQIDIWNEDGFVVGLPLRRAAYLLDKVAHRPPHARKGQQLSRLFSKEGLTNVQAEIVQYCAARLGFVQHPQMGGETIRHLQKILLDKANRIGITAGLNRELDLLTRVTRKSVSVSPRTPTLKRLDNVPDHQILTGVI